MSRNKLKGRKPPNSFYWIPKPVHRSADYRQLSGNAVKLLNALAYQFNGHNNGDLSATWSVMKTQHGFRSPTTLNHVRNELLAANLIYVTRQGGMGMCNLYALTWMPIDKCNGKLDYGPTIKTLRTGWNQTRVTAPRARRMNNTTVVEFAERKRNLQR